MKSWEAMLKPHCVYRIFDTAGALLYIGCSRHICARMAVHGSVQPWYREIARVEVTWFENEPTAKQAEAAAVEEEKPRHNRLIADPQNIGRKGSRAPRGDGVHCPKCGMTKENPRHGYCRACMRKYQQERRDQIGS